MKYKKSVFRSLALITQLGISMLVPIAGCVAIGVLIDHKFGTYWVIPLMFLGMAAGARNVYHLAMAASKEDDAANSNSTGKKNKYASYAAFKSELDKDSAVDEVNRK